MDKVIEYGMWPLSIMIIAIFAMVIFKGPIASMINRTKKIGAGSRVIEMTDAVADQQQSLAKPATESIAPVIGPASEQVDLIEGLVQNKLNEFSESPEQERSRLIRAVAETTLEKQFEQYYRVIFGSQLELMLRANAGVADMATAEAIFQQASSSFPEVHQNANSDLWMSFLVNTDLLAYSDDRSRLLITPKGKAFLHYLVSSGLTSQRSG